MYVKLFSSILDSSIWDEPAATRLVWITLLCLADEEGFVHGVEGAIARRAVVSREECATALRTLESPDSDSLHSDDGGRRIEKVEGGWRILNYVRFRETRTREQMRSAQRQRNRRERVADGRSANGSYVYYARSDDGHIKIGMSRNPWARVSELRTASPGIEILAVEPGDAETERERHAEFEEYHVDREWFTSGTRLLAHISSLQERSRSVATNVTTGTRSAATSASSSVSTSRTTQEEQEIQEIRGRDDDPAGFADCWDAYPKRGGSNNRRDALKAYVARLKAGATPDELLAGTQRYAAYIRATGRERTEYVKQAATFYGPSEHFREAWDLPQAPAPPETERDRVRRLALEAHAKKHAPTHPTAAVA